jgi:putative two-component system response regulator
MTSVLRSPRPASVLVVDDEPTLRKLGTRILSKAGYLVREAGDVAEARAAAREQVPDVVLVDLGLPDEPGSVLLEEPWVKSGEAVVIMVTGSNDLNLADEAFAKGAYGYVVKPYRANELVMQVSSALRRRDLERSMRNQVEELERKVVESAPALREIRARIEVRGETNFLADDEIIRLLISTVGLRDDETGRHIERVGITAAAVADWRGFKVDPATAVQLAAAMHDVGKIGIPDWVLLKPERLSSEERTIIERHCELGHRLLTGSSSVVLQLAASVALNHHERWDGTGYPNRKRGEEIPLEARITSVVDVFDALTHDRIYRTALPVETAVDIMNRERGGLFEPALLDLFLERLDDVLAVVAPLSDDQETRPIRVVVADDEQILLAGLIRVINRSGLVQVVGTAGGVTAALQTVERSRPDVVLSDFKMADGDGAMLAEEVVRRFPETRVLILTGMATPDVALRCIAAGCAGVMPKTSSLEDVIDAIRRVRNGELVIPSDVLPAVVSGLKRREPTVGSDITPRELDVLNLLAKGVALPEISATLSISFNTARNHTQRVMEKLGAHSKLEAVVVATREGIISAI